MARAGLSSIQHWTAELRHAFLWADHPVDGECMVKLKNAVIPGGRTRG